MLICEIIEAKIVSMKSEEKKMTTAQSICLSVINWLGIDSVFMEVFIYQLSLTNCNIVFAIIVSHDKNQCYPRMRYYKVRTSFRWKATELRTREQKRYLSLMIHPVLFINFK